MTTADVIDDATHLASMGLKPADALHVASAAAADCDCFITTDIRLLRRVREFKSTRMLNPMEFLMEVEDGI